MPFVVKSSKGSIATHYLEVWGRVDLKKWSEGQLRDFVEKKLAEVHDSWSPDMDLFYLKGDKIRVGIFVSMSTKNEVILNSAKNWVKNHIPKDSGLFPYELMCKTVFDMHLSEPFKEENLKI